MRRFRHSFSSPLKTPSPTSLASVSTRDIPMSLKLPSPFSPLSPYRKRSSISVCYHSSFPFLRPPRSRYRIGLFALSFSNSTENTTRSELRTPTRFHSYTPRSQTLARLLPRNPLPRTRCQPSRTRARRDDDRCFRPPVLWAPRKTLRFYSETKKNVPLSLKRPRRPRRERASIAPRLRPTPERFAARDSKGTGRFLGRAIETPALGGRGGLLLFLFFVFRATLSFSSSFRRRLLSRLFCSRAPLRPTTTTRVSFCEERKHERKRTRTHTVRARVFVCRVSSRQRCDKRAGIFSAYFFCVCMV